MGLNNDSLVFRSLRGWGKIGSGGSLLIKEGQVWVSYQQHAGLSLRIQFSILLAAQSKGLVKEQMVFLSLESLQPKFRKKTLEFVPHCLIFAYIFWLFHVSSE